ncbi:MAG: DNA-3-methyladenine glycosylase 2 family protein [Polyangiaceae bacterium]|nr:DNA-3-methyladenine glycosylase 2 family protein [Polyangiaceae bacterium]
MDNNHPHAEAMRVLSAADDRLAEVIAEVGACRLRVHTNGNADAHEFFEALVESIVSQQLSTKAADTIYARVLALGGGKLLPPSELGAVPEETLRKAGLSGQKVRYVQDLCTKVGDGSVVLTDLEKLGDEEVIQRLRLVKGIGRWTAEMFLMFRLGRPDVLPVQDLGIQQGMRKLYKMRTDPTPDRMVKVAKKWRPYRSVACWYLWRVHEKVK